MELCKYLSLTILFSTHLIADPVREFWFSGAEINRYELSQMRYGQSHPGHAEFIFVTEPFLIDAQVKHEFGKGLSTDVLKLNALRTFNTGIYSYRTMTSTFQPIDLQAFPHALKTTTTVQDWCGQAFQQINRSDNGWNLELRSYFQSEGDRNQSIPDLWLEDELWTRLRLDPQSLPLGKLELVPGAIFTRFAHRPLQPEKAVATLESRDERSSYTVRYPEINRKLIIRFDRTFPHIIREWEAHEPTGITKAVLTHRQMNSEYWSQNKPGHSQKRKSLGLAPIAD